MKIRRVVNPLTWLLVVLTCSASCAMGNSERRRALNYLDANWIPSTATGRWLAAPIALPAGLAAGVTDAVVLHPLSQIDDSWSDTVSAVWDFSASTEFRTVLLVPLSTIATPVVFGGTWLFRSVIDCRDSGQESVTQIEGEPYDASRDELREESK